MDITLTGADGERKNVRVNVTGSDPGLESSHCYLIILPGNYYMLQYYIIVYMVKFATTVLPRIIGRRLLISRAILQENILSIFESVNILENQIVLIDLYLK